MSIKNKRVVRAIIIAVVSCVILTLYSYIFDCIYNFSYAKQEINTIVAYLLFYLLLRIWGVFGIIILYNLLSKISNNLYFTILKIIVITAICSVLGKYVGRNDWNITVGGSFANGTEVDSWKYIYVYAFAGLTTCVLYEWLNNKRPLTASISSLN